MTDTKFTPGSELYEAAASLREAQKQYMAIRDSADRSTRERAGKAVARAAEALDTALAKARGEQ